MKAMALVKIPVLKRIKDVKTREPQDNGEHQWYDACIQLTGDGYPGPQGRS